MNEQSSHAKHGTDEITRDARKELWLIPQALLAFAVVAAIAVVRELVLR
ncbi:hypothetical protein G7066_14070 [Leucobacter coleopterorum]|uniref:Uncharacterized protein n=1 Tax=Leucobacter coleopterorum TaxID=2714933 RepID=A0ABX6JYP5_9MICO|nr:hypothetical protein [Leucobacter coleopterorum]QIM19421.1 hypothetical protein G7066_14070 [Leucobacter coleopterorum]